MFKYILTVMGRNKKRTLLLMFGLIISVSLIISVNLASNKFANYLMEKEIDKVVVDFKVESTNLNYDLYASKVDELIASDEGFEYFFISNLRYYTQMALLKAGGLINWSNLPSNAEVFDGGYFCGLDRDILQNGELAQRISTAATFDSSSIAISQDGLYINKDIADILEITAGELISIAIFQDMGEQGQGNPEKLIKGDNATTSMINIPILGIYDILDYTLFAQLFEVTYEYDYMAETMQDALFTPILLGNLDYIANITRMIKNNLLPQFAEVPYFIEYQYDNFLVDHEILNFYDELAFMQQLADFQSKIYNIYEDLSTEAYPYSKLQDTYYQINSLITTNQILMIIITIPVILLSWFLVRTNYYLSFNQRRREIGLLKSKGGYTKQIRSLFLKEAMTIGFLSGFIGILVGTFTAVFIINLILPDLIIEQSIGTTIIQFMRLGFVDSFEWIWALGIGMLLSILAVLGPLKIFTEMPAIDALEKYHEEYAQESKRKKIDYVLLIVGAVPIILSVLVNILPAQVLYQNYIIFMLLSMSLPLLPIAPFILIYALVNILCGRSLSLFSKIIHIFDRVFSDKIALFSSKSILRNQARSSRLIFIIAISMSFMIMASTLNYSESYFQANVIKLETANGLVVNLQSENIGTLQPQNYVNYLWSQNDTIQSNGYNWMAPIESTQIDDNGDPVEYEQSSYNYGYMGGLGLRAITAMNFSLFIELNPDWFIDINPEDAMKKLDEDGSAILMPEIVKQNGFEIGDKVQFSYSSSNHISYMANFTIIGFFKNFPLLGDVNWMGPAGLVNWNAIATYSATSMKLVLYTDNEKITEGSIIHLLKRYDSAVQKVQDDYYSAQNQQNIMRILKNILSFLDLEAYYMLIIVVFGVGIIMYISISEKSHDLGILRARGVDKKAIFKIQFIEGIILISIGLIFSLIGIVGSYGILLEFDMISNYSSYGRVLIVPWLTIIGQLGLALLLFTGIILFAVYFETKKSDISRITDILRLN